MKKMIRAEIINIAETDAYSDIAHLLIGVRGWARDRKYSTDSDWSYGVFVPYRATEELKKEVVTGRLWFYCYQLKKL